MAVKFKSKGKTQAKKKTSKAKTSVLNKLVDKLGAVHRLMKPLQDGVKVHQKNWKPLFSEIQTLVDETTDAGKETSVTTEKNVAAFTPHGIVTTVTDSDKAFKLLESVEKGLAWKLMGFSITELRKYLTPDQFESITEESRTKARSVTITYLDED